MFEIMKALSGHDANLRACAGNSVALIAAMLCLAAVGCRRSGAQSVPVGVEIGMVRPPFMYRWRDDHTVLAWRTDTSGHGGMHVVAIDIRSKAVKVLDGMRKSLDDAVGGASTGVGITETKAAWVRQSPRSQPLLVVTDLAGLSVHEVSLPKNVLWSGPQWLTPVGGHEASDASDRTRIHDELAVIGEEAYPSVNHTVFLANWSEQNGTSPAQQLPRECDGCGFVAGISSANNLVVTDLGMSDHTHAGVTICEVSVKGTPQLIRKHVYAIPAGLRLLACVVGSRGRKLAWLFARLNLPASSSHPTSFEVRVSGITDGNLSTSRVIRLDISARPIPASLQSMPGGDIISLADGSQLKLYSLSGDP